MPICEHCHEEFPRTIVIDGKRRYMSKRKYCFNCSPFGAHNTMPPGYIRQTPKKKQDHAKIYNYRKQLKLKAIEYKGGKCQICGYDRCIQALEFHHIDPSTKTASVSTASRGWDWVKQEIDKCILVCANCHREIEHGITVMPS